MSWRSTQIDEGLEEYPKNAAGAVSGTAGPFLPEPIASTSRQRISAHPPVAPALGKVIYLFATPPAIPHIEMREVEEPQAEQAQSDFQEPERNYDCSNYSACLGLAAALDWTSFTCRGCNGCVNEQLLWKAHQRVRDNKTLQSVCNLPVLR